MSNYWNREDGWTLYSFICFIIVLFVLGNLSRFYS